MKYAANTLTGMRIALSILMLAFLDNRTVIFVIFAAAGLTDALDGIVARLTGTVSHLGARLDSAADIVMFGMMIVCTVVWAGAELWTLLPWLASVAALRWGNLVIAVLKYKTFAIIHTWGNKLTGLLIVVSFGIYILTDSLAALLPVIIVAGISAIEEALILLTSSTLNLDRKSLFCRSKEETRRN